eukprot:760309-Hanusia_phi.AAC.2
MDRTKAKDFEDIQPTEDYRHNSRPELHDDAARLSGRLQQASMDTSFLPDVLNAHCQRLFRVIGGLESSKQALQDAITCWRSEVDNTKSLQVLRMVSSDALLTSSQHEKVSPNRYNTANTSPDRLSPNRLEMRDQPSSKFVRRAEQTAVGARKRQASLNATPSTVCCSYGLLCHAHMFDRSFSHFVPDALSGCWYLLSNVMLGAFPFEVNHRGEWVNYNFSIASAFALIAFNMLSPLCFNALLSLCL